MGSVELKVKVKSLAAEARIIRREEKGQLRQARYLNSRQQDGSTQYTDYENLRHHRTDKVRKASRSASIAHALLKGVPYSAIEEPRLDNTANWSEIRRLMSRYGGKEGRMLCAEGELAAQVIEQEKLDDRLNAERLTHWSMRLLRR